MLVSFYSCFSNLAEILTDTGGDYDCSSGRSSRTLRIAGDRLIYPLHPFGRVEPAVTQFDQPPGSFSNGNSGRIAGGIIP